MSGLARATALLLPGFPALLRRAGHAQAPLAHGVPLLREVAGLLPLPPGARAWWYPFGCLVLQGMEEAQERAVLAALAAHKPPVQYSAAYRETAEFSPGERDEAHVRALCAALARSVYLRWAQDAASALLDTAGGLLHGPGRGARFLRAADRRRLAARSLRLERNLAGFLFLAGRPQGERDAFARFSARYELAERLEAAEAKLAAVRGILSAAHGSAATRAENRLLLFEVALLAAFPLFFLAELLPEGLVGALAHWWKALLP